MRIPTVEKFLCCLKLELGPLIIGWIGMLCSFVSLLFLSVLFFWAIVAYSNLMEKLPSDQYISDLMRNYSPILVKFIILIFIVYFGVYFYACKRLLECIKTRNSSDTIPFLALIIFDLIFSFLSIFHFTWIALIQGLISMAIYGYVFICIWSVKQFLADEARRSQHRNSQYQSAPLTMFKF